MNYQRGSSMEILLLLFKPVLEVASGKQQHFKDNSFRPEDFKCFESFTQKNLLLENISTGSCLLF